MAVIKTITAIALISGFTFIYIPDYRCVHHLRKDILAEQCSVVGEFFAAGFFELMQQIFDGEFLFLFAFDVQDDLAVHKHDQTIAVSDGIFHVMGDHDGCQMIPVDDHIRCLKDFGCCLRIKGCCMFIQKQKPSKESVPVSDHRITTPPLMSDGSQVQGQGSSAVLCILHALSW